jgi:hypothetical protein
MLNVYLGHYKALEWDPEDRKYVKNEELGINIEVLVRRRGCTHPSAGMPLDSDLMLIESNLLIGSRYRSHCRQNAWAR